MAVCEACNKETTDPKTTSCIAEPVQIKVTLGGFKLMPLIFMPEELDASARCPTCGILRGGFHHAGCDQEDCPNCGGNLFSCACLELIGQA